MANEVNITVAAKTDADEVLASVGDAAVRTERVVTQAMGSTEQAFDTAARGSGRLGAALDQTAGFGGNLADGLDGAGQAAQSLSDIMSYSERSAEDLARAQQDVAQAAQDAEQALQDLDQAERDAAQAGLDLEQAALDVKQSLIDQKVAQQAYNEAVKKFGPDSNEALQAQQDLNQAKFDSKQAAEDAKQAEEDLAQANLTSKQAVLDHKDAQNQLKASQRELGQQGSILKKVSDWGGMLSGVLGGLVGVIGAITAVQWAWNAALLANPVGLVVAGIILLIGIIVLIATKTTWFQTMWNAIWGAIGEPVKAVFEFIKSYYVTMFNFWMSVLEKFKNFFVAMFKFAVDWAVKYFKFIIDIPNKIVNAFKAIGEAIYAPFKWAFNMIAKAWNNTVGKIGFSVPNWVPGFGGNSFSIPKIPMLQSGGRVMSTGLAVVHKGETVVPATAAPLTASAQRMQVEVTSTPGDPLASFISMLSARVRTTMGGTVDAIGAGTTRIAGGL